VSRIDRWPIDRARCQIGAGVCLGVLMIGRLLGLVVGVLILAFGFGLWKPEVAAKYEHFLDFAKVHLAIFDPYRTIIAFLVMGFGLVVGIAAVQREPARKKTRHVATVLSEPEETSHAPPAAHDDHAHPERAPAGAHHH
jgi:hypothetical protein